MVAETRRAQASTSDFERELAANADMGRQRAQLLADSIRDLGGVPDVVGVAAGRFTASAKAALEQGQEFIEAVLGDLAVEHELLARTRVAAMMAEHLEVRSLRRTLERLERAHTETVDWLMTRLGEVAAGGPAALRPTPLQSVVGFGRRLSTMPVRNVSYTLNRSIDNADQARRQAAESVRTNGERIRELVEAAGEIWTAGRDASLKRTEQIADERGERNALAPCTGVAATSAPLMPTSCPSVVTTPCGLTWRLPVSAGSRASTMCALCSPTRPPTRPARVFWKPPSRGSATSRSASPPSPHPTTSAAEPTQIHGRASLGPRPCRGTTRSTSASLVLVRAPGPTWSSTALRPGIASASSCCAGRIWRGVSGNWTCKHQVWISQQLANNASRSRR